MSASSTSSVLLQFDILDQLFDGVCVLDRERRVAAWNRAAERITGYLQEDIKGRRCADGLLMHADSAGCVLCEDRCPVAATIDDGQAREAQVWVHHQAGHRLPILVRVLPHEDASGERTGAVQLFTDNVSVQKLAERVAELERMAMVDALTELPNRRYLEMTLQTLLARHERFQAPCGVILVDLDHFKFINDTFGHEVGDEALRMVARTMRATARASDTVGRWGGEEFLVLVPDAEREAVICVAERQRVMVERSQLATGDQPLLVTFSAGFTMLQKGDDVASVLRRADERLYEAKHTGRNRVVG